MVLNFSVMTNQESTKHAAPGMLQEAKTWAYMNRIATESAKLQPF